MKILIDGAPGFALSGSPSTLLDALDQILAHLDSQRRGLQSVNVDGQLLPLSDVDETTVDRPIHAIREISVHSEPLAVRARSVLADLRAVLPELPQVCRDLGRVFSSDTPDEGYPLFDHLALVWQTVKTQQVQVARAIGVPLAELVVEKQAIAAQTEALNHHLAEAAAAVEKRDTVTLSDLLEYELAPLAEFESAIVESLAAELAGMG